MIDDPILPMPGCADAIMNKANSVVHLVEGEVKEPTQAETDGQSIPKG